MKKRGISLNFHDVKFMLNLDDEQYSIIGDVFNRAKGILNWRFDENFNAYQINGDIDYQVRDVCDSNDIDEITRLFFSFNFDNITDVALYRFLVLKGSEGTVLLAHVSSLIFDYSTVNDFYGLFKDSNRTLKKPDLDSYYSNVNDYLSSPDYMKDSAYWKNLIQNSSGYVKFQSPKGNDFKIQRINTDGDAVSEFIEGHGCSLTDFYGSVLALYLSRIDRLEGCLLKTVTARKNLNEFDRNIILKIDAGWNASFNDLLSGYKSSFNEAADNTGVDVENYLDENVTFYSVHDFTGFNDNVRIFCDEDSALTLNIYGNSPELVCKGFSEEYVRHMVANIESLIDSVIASPEKTIAETDILSDNEKELIGRFSRGKSVEVETDRIFSRAFRQHALSNPDAVAVDDGVGRITYAELERSTNSIARDLYEHHGIGPQSRVAVMLRRNYRFPELVVALNKIGAAYVPIDVLFPAGRIEHMLNIAEVAHLITSEDIARNLDFNVNVITVEELDDKSETEVEILAKKDDLFTILFTSGTTGLPKGVTVYNRQIPWCGAAFSDMFSFAGGDVIGSYFSFSFVASFVIIAALYFGGCVRIFNEEEQKNSLLLIRAINERHMNSLILPPSVGIPLIENEDLNLDYLILAGAKLNELAKRDMHTRLVNFYGTTEVIFAASKIYDVNDIEDDRVPIGRPVANSGIYILDERGNRMPVGVAGEICISGGTISGGYCNDPELTGEVFVDNPYPVSESDRTMYRTGDIGFYNFEGELEIIGREDDQLSVRGFRIESEEILGIMKGFEWISDIYLDADDDNLAAYYTADGEGDISDVRKALKDSLPYYMIPSLFIELDEIPRNINGKIDKSQLKRVMKPQNIEIADDVISCVVDAFEDVLNVDCVLIDDGFVSLGGNSLSAMKLQLELKEKLGVSLSSNELIELSTPKDIADYIKYNLNVHSQADEEKYSFEESCPLSESQLNVYLDESVNDMGTAYNNPFRIDFKGDYSAGEIRAGLGKLFEAFPILRARVQNGGDGPLLAFDAEPEITEAARSEIESFVRPFDMERCLSRFLISDDGGSAALCADFHHMIFDGTSLGILLERFFPLMTGEASGPADRGMLRQVSFEQNIDSDYRSAAHDFFDGMLADRDEAHDLMACINGDEEYEFIESFDVNTERLGSFLKSHSLTYNQFFTGVFGYALSRFTGCDKVLFNMVEDGRGHIDLSESVGMFVKTLPVLMDCSNRKTDSFLRYCSGIVNSVMKYDMYPFRLLAGEYDLNSNVIFQYSHDLFSDAVNNSFGCTVCEMKHDLNADLSFFIMNSGESRMTIRILYSPLYSRSFIGRFAESYRMILDGITKADELKDITFTTETDIGLLNGHNRTQHDLTCTDIMDAFNDSLQKHPDSILVSYRNVSYSFSEGAYIADAIARKLAQMGINAQDRVSFLVPRSEVYMFCVLAVMSAGGVYVPLDGNLPDERIAFMIRDTGSKVLIVTDETLERGEVLGEDCEVLNISGIMKGEVKTLDRLNCVSGNLACILYTSGSTGLPKGVRITRKSIAHFIDFHVHDLEIHHGDVYGLYASVGFDVAMAAIFSAVYSGASMNVIPDDIKLDIEAMNRHFIKYGVTHTYITTQIAKMFIGRIEETSLKVLVAGGEKLGRIDEVRDYRIVDAYGPTEACVYVISADTRDKIDYSSVGHVQNNTKAYLLDGDLRRVPVGAVGELYLSGPQLADGYLNRAGETSKAFMANPFEGENDYETLYRTGDVARMLPDGTYGVIGRRDGQVKIRGNRVELSEIEAAIREMDCISDVTVQTTGNELAAYVVSSDENRIREKIQDYVRIRKPEYMVPSFVVSLDEIPLNVNGKVDRRRLPEVDFDSLHAEYAAPETEDERAVVEAFEKVFGRRIGIHDDFIRLGGDSLSAVRLVSYLKGYSITAVDILSLHTPHAIAENITRLEFDPDIYTLESGCPLNESQLNVYLDIQVNGKDDAYLIPLFTEISKKHDVSEICDALMRMFEVHPILSMRISDESEVPYLVRGASPQISVEDEVTEEFIIEFLNRPFELTESLCRFLIVNDDDTYKLFSSFSHIIFDALSGSVFGRDLKRVLDGEMPDVDESFLRSSAFSQQIKKSEEYLNAERFYESMLANADESGILIESVDAEEQGKVNINLELDGDSLKSFLKRNGVSENVLFTSAFAYALSRFTGSETALFNLVENGRDRFGNFGSIGMYVNTLPLLVECKNQSVSSFMENVAGRIYDVVRYNYYPFRLLANKYGITSDVLFQYLPEWIGNGEYADTINGMEQDIIARRENQISDFNVEVAQNGDIYTLSIMYCDRYSKDFARHFAESYKLILQQIVNADELAGISYITDRDIEILNGYNHTQHDFDYGDVLEAFNVNLEKYEDRLLVGYMDTRYTHGEGAFIADEIADRLRDMGIERQDCTALFVNRSEWFLLAAMGVLTMGGIYVPIDTSYPAERILLMLEDTESKAVIVDDDSIEDMERIISQKGLDIDVLNASDITSGEIASSNHLKSVEVKEDDIACILYTSGTTGVPKGVRVTRKAINNFVSWYVSETGFTSGDVYGMHCSYVFDMHTHALYSPVITGGALYVVPEDIRLDLKALNDYFVEHGCSHTYITSQVGKLFAESGFETTIKLICFGGMKLGELNAPDSIGPFESYGPSENLAISTSIFANRRMHHSSIGRFISNVRGYVLDSEHRRVPIGAVGELYLSGAQLTPGYLNRSEENARAFFTNPFDDEEGYEQIYGTGDIVRFLPDGTLGIVGRRDSQVKIRGNRVELTEVESAIREMEEIADVTVQIISNDGNNELVSYIVLSEGFEADDYVEHVRQYVLRRKPEYMVPSYVVKLDEIPLNVNGKVDKSALPEVDVESLHAEYVAPSNETERHITGAFEDVFNQKSIGLNDDFIRLGGDSITAIRVITLLEKEGIACSARDILNYKTPYLIAQNIEHAESVSYEAVEGAVDLLPIQEYFISEIGRNDFTQQVILKSKEKLEINTLQEAFNELYNVHDMLRAKFSSGESGKIIQEIRPVNTRISKISEYDVQDNLDESLKDIYIKSSDSISIKDNLIEIGLIHHSSESYLMLIIHHLITDAVSWNILISDLTSIYSGLKEGDEIKLSRPYPYRNWVEDVRGLSENITSEERNHWRRINDLLDDAAIKGDSKHFSFSVNADYDTDNLLMLSEEEYWALAIARAYKMTYGQDIIFSRETHGRDESIAKTNRTIGWFTSQYPILASISNGHDDISLMSDVYSIKASIRNVNNMGLNYLSMIYTSGELEFRHCPVTFNFLSGEFSFENELFTSAISDYVEISADKKDSKAYGITFNIIRSADSYIISGDYAENTYIGEGFGELVENVKSELEFLKNHRFENSDIVCCLSESQLGIYLDEKVNDKGSAYSTPGIFEYDCKYSAEDVKEAISALIKKHPILRGRVLDTGDIPLLVCDGEPAIETVGNEDYSTLIKPFDLDRSLARFFILKDRSVFYDMHHIISDATSRTIINKELKEALRGELDDTVDLGFAYASRDSFESRFDAKYKSSREFFQREFADIDEIQYMPEDINGDAGSVSLPIRGVREKAESFAAENGITIGNLLNAVFAYTYSRFTGSDRVFYNFTEHGRHENYLKDSLGMYVRTIPIIADCKDCSVGDFASGMSDSILESMANGTYPFRLIAKEFDLTSDVLFEYNYDLVDFDIGDDIVERREADSVSEFMCVVNDLEDGFVVSVSHLDRFTQHTAGQFVKAFGEIFVQFLEKENLRDIIYISQEDLELLDGYNQSEHDFEDVEILEAFNGNLKRHPESRLVEYGDVSYTFAQGASIADAVARRLVDLGVEAGDMVSFLVPRSELYMFAILAVMSAGGVYVPIDDRLPDERAEFMIRDTSSRVVIVSDETCRRADNLAGDAALLNISDIIRGNLETVSCLPVISAPLLCILYTSGTTGLAKGVKITKKAIRNYIEFNVCNLEIQPGDVYGLYASIGFDVAMAGIFSAICGGACLNVIPDDIKLNVNALNRHFIKYNVAYTDLATQIAKLFIGRIDETSLKVLVAAGEKLGRIDERRDYRIVDAYGPTEACVTVTRIDVADKIDPSSVGSVNCNTKAYVLDSELRRVPVGAVGELCLSGRQLADGYLNRDEETSKAFMANPFENSEEYAVLYRTGDMARVLEDGTYAIIGRRDSQVKIRGNRLELTEVESAIREIGFVEDVTVQTVMNGTNSELASYVVVNNGLAGDDLTDSVCGYVRERKPDYMVPSYVIPLDAIPLNVNGKVDKGALPEVDRAGLHAEYVAARNENEKKITEAFEKALNLENVSIYDDFIRLGGDSLTAVRLLSYIDSEISMADIFTFRTPEAIAKNMSDLSFDLDLYSLEGGCPLNGAQLNVFADVIIYNKVNAYHVPGYIPIPKRYALQDILDALNAILDAHPILGMRMSDIYESGDEESIGNLELAGDLMRTVKKFGTSQIMRIARTYGLRNPGGLYNMVRIVIRLFKGEYPYLQKGERPEISTLDGFDKNIIIDFLGESFDIFRSMAKFMVVETEDSFYVLYLIHHIIFDAVSAGVLKDDLMRLLDGKNVEPEDTFLETSALTRQMKACGKFDEADEYYYPILSDLSDVGRLEEDATEEGYSISVHNLEFDKDAFKSFLNRTGISENVLFTAAFAYALSQFTDGERVIFTMIENGRDRFRGNFIGMTSNVMPVVADCRNQRIDSYMNDMADSIYGALQHSYYPILLLYQKYNFEVDILFQLVPNWIADDFHNAGDGLAEEILDEVLERFSDNLAKLFVQIYQNGDEYRLILTHSNRYSERLMDDFRDAYISILSGIIGANPTSSLSDIPK